MPRSATACSRPDRPDPRWSCSSSAINGVVHLAVEAFGSEAPPRFNPRSRAAPIPGASGRLEITTAISASKRPAAIASAIATKFEPRPESRMPRRFIGSITRTPRARRAPPRRWDTKARAACSSIFPASGSLRGETTRIMPMPRLKVRRQSCSGMCPILRSSSKIGGTGQEPRSMRTPKPSGRMRGVLSVMPPPVMCAAPLSKPASCERAQRLQIAAVQLQQLVARRAAQFVNRVSRAVPGHFEQQLARQRVAVGVQPGGGQPEQHVAGADRRAGEHALALDRAHDEAGQIVFAGGVEARHLGGLAADQRAAVVPAAARDAGDHLRPPRAHPACPPRNNPEKTAARRLARRCRSRSGSPGLRRPCRGGR